VWVNFLHVLTASKYLKGGPLEATQIISLREIKDLPGPRAWPVVGNLLSIKPLRIHQDMESLARRYGTVFRVFFGRRAILVIADHLLVAGVLRDRPERFRRPSLTAAVSREMGGTPGLFLAEGVEWRNQRRMVMAGFAPGPIRAYFPSLVKVANRLQKRWHAAAAQGSSITLDTDLKRYTVDIIAGLAFGTEVNTIESGEDVIQQYLDDILPAIARRSLSLFPYWRYFKLPRDRRLDHSVKSMREAVNELVLQARARLQAEPERRIKPPNLLEAMIVAADSTESGVSDDAVAGNVSTMLLAGEDTTANTISWMIYLLHQNPDTLAKASEEVRRLAPDCANFTIEQMDSLSYMDACISEAMRLKPVAPFMPLEATKDTEVAGVRVPAGTIVWNTLRHDTVDEKYFPNPTQFNPDRWPNAHAKVSMPFGSGPRTCPGRYLAILEIKIAMAMLLGSFQIKAVDTPDAGEAKELMAFVMSPIGLTMRLSSQAA
jgi:cytochrome P450